MNQTAETLKRCPRCCESKPTSEFSKNSTTTDGLQTYCRPCCKAYIATPQEAPASKVCSRCEEDKPISEYHKRGGGHAYYCKACARKRALADVAAGTYRTPEFRARGRVNAMRYLGKEGNREKMHEYQRSEKGKQLNRRQYEKHQDKLPARQSVKEAIEKGWLPRAYKLRCFKCGDVAREYHHSVGYAPDALLDVVPICRLCHRKIHRKDNESSDIQVIA